MVKLNHNQTTRGCKAHQNVEKGLQFRKLKPHITISKSPSHLGKSAFQDPSAPQVNVELPTMPNPLAHVTVHVLPYATPLVHITDAELAGGCNTGHTIAVETK